MPRLRAAIYARHSSDKQNPLSSSDQVEACRPLLRQLEADMIGTYTDPEISGYRRDRPGLMQLLRDVEDGLVDIVLCEALDRIARDGEDISWLGKKLTFHRVRLFTEQEREIDEIKLAVAALLGSMFLSNLRTKTYRGLKAAILAGRLGGERAYGYRKVRKQDEDGNDINGVFEIHPDQAEVVLRIHRDFAAGRSSIQIATALNLEGVPGPRGGEWNTSTIRGDPKKLVGILNNPLYVGKLVWGRREWRKNPDSDRRERRYRLRDPEEWVMVDMPDLRIVDSELAADVAAEMKRRQIVPGKRTDGSAKRGKHLLSGIIKCAACGSSFTLVGKDYHRCSRNRERGTCGIAVTVRVAAVEEAALSALQSQLLTPDLVKLFTEEFNREVARLTRTRGEADETARRKLAELDRGIENLASHFLAGSVSPTLARMLAEREDEKAVLERQLAAKPAEANVVIPHPVLLKRYEAKVSKLREALNDDLIRTEAAATLRSLIAAVTVHVEDSRPVLEVEASTSTLIEFAKRENPRRSLSGGFVSRSGTVVAGTGFGRCRTRFRLRGAAIVSDGRSGAER